MKKLIKTIAPVAIVSLGLVTTVNAQTPQQAVKDTISKKSVSYQCDAKKTLKVVYGFNKQGLPTFAQASLYGKKRFMPINLNRSDNVDLIFGDENNFSLSTASFDRTNYRTKPILVTSPSNEIVFKNCMPKR